MFLASVMFCMARVFFTGAFRKPREINWTIGLTLFMFVATRPGTSTGRPQWAAHLSAVAESAG